MEIVIDTGTTSTPLKTSIGMDHQNHRAEATARLFLPEDSLYLKVRISIPYSELKALYKATTDPQGKDNV